MALDTVTDYVAQARALLQDKTHPVRYSDHDLIDALNLGLMEARKLRPDLYLGASPGLLTTPDIGGSAGDPMSTIDVQYRVPLLYFMVGHALERDEEDGSERRAMSYKQRFAGGLLALGSV
jgi:hypothetical protein